MNTCTNKTNKFFGTTRLLSSLLVLIILASSQVLGGNVIVKNGDLNVSGSTLFSGNVGVGTQSPGNNFEVQVPGSSWVGMNLRTSSAILGQLVRDGSTGAGDLILNNATGANKVWLTGSGNSYLTGGNVGVGTSGPSGKLDVYGNMVLTDYSGVARPNLLFTEVSLATPTNAPMHIIDFLGGEIAEASNGTHTLLSNVYVGQVDVIPGTAAVTNTASLFVLGAMDAVGANNYAMWVQSGTSRFDGNVGIGNSSPASKLTVAGTIESTSGGVKFPDGTIQTTAASGGGWITSGSNLFSSNTGNVGIGSNNPAAKLDVNGTVRTNGQITSTVATGTAPFAVSSTTKVTSLNSDMLDGVHATDLNGGSVMYLHGSSYPYGAGVGSNCNSVSYPTSACPSGWSQADIQLMKNPESSAGGSYSLCVRTCYRTDAVCQVMYLYGSSYPYGAGPGTYCNSGYASYPTSACPAGWSQADIQLISSDGSAYSKCVRTCYRCGTTPS